MRSLISSLISDALSDMFGPREIGPEGPPYIRFSTLQCGSQSFEAAVHGAVNDQIAGADDGATDEARVDDVLELDRARQPSLERALQRRARGVAERSRGAHLDLDASFGLVTQALVCGGDLWQHAEPPVVG